MNFIAFLVLIALLALPLSVYLVAVLGAGCLAILLLMNPR